MAWFYLILGGLFEVGFTTCLRFADGFRNVPWTLGFLASVTLSMGLRQSFGTVRLKLWDEERRRLVSFREAGISAGSSAAA